MKTILIFSFLCIPFLTQAQTNFKEGLVVTAAGDTLNGFIDYKEWNYNPREFAFKPALTDNQSQQFTAQTARYVAIGGYEVYDSRRVSISQDEVAGGRITEGMDTAYNTEQLKWYIGAGTALNYRLVTNNKLSYSRTDQDVILFEGENADFLKIRKLGLTMILRSGIMLNKNFDLSVLYNPAVRINSQSTNNYGSFTLTSSSLQVSGGYFF